MNERIVLVSLSVALLVVGVFGLALESEEVSTQQNTEVNTSTLRVEEATQQPQSTIDHLQGSGGLQSGGGQVQTGNAGSSLQPNAGADSLPESY